MVNERKIKLVLWYWTMNCDNWCFHAKHFATKPSISNGFCRCCLVTLSLECSLFFYFYPSINPIKVKVPGHIQLFRFKPQIRNQMCCYSVQKQLPLLCWVEPQHVAKKIWKKSKTVIVWFRCEEHYRQREFCSCRRRVPITEITLHS